MILVEKKIDLPVAILPSILLRASRISIAKKIWRGTADDGQEFGFSLEAPLRHGETFYQTDTARYIIEQVREKVLEIPTELPASAVAGIGWAVGNLHLEMSADAKRILLPDESAARALLGRLRIDFTATEAVFQPGRFVRGEKKIDELGTSHRH